MEAEKKINTFQEEEERKLKDIREKSREEGNKKIEETKKKAAEILSGKLEEAKSAREKTIQQAEKNKAKAVRHIMELFKKHAQ